MDGIDLESFGIFAGLNSEDGQGIRYKVGPPQLAINAVRTPGK